MVQRDAFAKQLDHLAGQHRELMREVHDLQVAHARLATKVGGIALLGSGIGGAIVALVPRILG